MASDAFQDLCLPPAPATSARLSDPFFLLSLEDRERGPLLPPGLPQPARPSTNPGSRQARRTKCRFPTPVPPSRLSQSQSIYF